MIAVGILGALRASVDGREVDLGSAQRRAVLARLAVAAGAVVSTDRLIDDLWNGEPPPRALAGLQAHVSHLRRVLEPRRAPREPARHLVSVAPGYALRIDDGLDAVRVAEALRRAREEPADDAVVTLRAALACWTGPVLGEFADQPWATPEIERLEELRRATIEALAAREMEREGVDAAVGLLRPHVREHPLREEATGLLARALYRAGRQAEAMALLSDLRRRLDDELGLTPSPAVRELERRILVHDADLAPTPPAPRREGGFDDAERHRSHSPAIGRDGELARLRAAGGRARRGPGELVLVGGEAGAGKSTLLAEAARWAEGAGWRTVRGRCPEVDGAPAGWAWTEIGEALGVAGGPSTFLAGQALVAALTEAPTLVCLDDLHRGDDATLRLLRVVVSAAAPGVLVVAGYRPGEVSEDLLATIASLTAATGDRLELAGLDVAGTAALLARHGVPVEDDAAARVAARTGGNPLFVREVARLAGTVGLATAERTVPAGVRDVLRRRIGQLPASAASVLRHAAALGRDVDVDLLVALEDDAEERVLSAVEAAVVTGLLAAPDDAETVRFSHDLVREVLYDEVPALRRARLHAGILDVLERRRPHDRPALARHALAAGAGAGIERVLDHAERGAATALAGRSPRGAADLLGAALALAEGRVAAGRRVRLRCAHARALAHAGASLGAVRERAAAVAEARALAGAAPDGAAPDGAAPDGAAPDGAAPGDAVATRDDLLLAAVTCVDAPMSFALDEDGRLDRALIDAAGTLLERDIPARERVRVLAARAFTWHPEEPERGFADAEDAAALLATVPDADPLLRCLVLNARFWSRLTPERWHELDDLGRELVDEAARAGSWGYRTVGQHARFLHATYRHDFDAARAWAGTALAEAPDGQLAATLGWSTVFAGMHAVVDGRLEEAEETYRRVSDALTERGVANAGYFWIVGLFGIRLAQGRFAELVEPLSALHARVPVYARDPLALALCEAGREAEAREVWRTPGSVRRDWWWLLWAALRAEAALRLDDRAAMRTSRDELAPWSGHLAGAMSGTATLGPVDDVLARLDARL